MTRLAKLDARFRAGHALDFAELVRLLQAYGFRHVRTVGSHRIFARDSVVEQISVQPRGKEAKPYQVRQFRRIVEDNKLGLEGEA